jgi:predicted nucleic acid-binding protein
MTFSNTPAGVAVFVDANTLIYHFTSDTTYGAACTQLIKKEELQQIGGFTSTHILADVAHRLMTLEAMQLFGWPYAGIASRLRKHSGEILKLNVYRQAIASIPRFGFQIIPITLTLVESATLSRHQLLMGDAMIVALMEANGITDIASNDGDFDLVPGIRRYSPV